MGHVDTDSTRRWRSGFARTYSRSSGWHVSRSTTVSRLRARVADGRRPERAARDVPNVSACGFRPGVSSVHVSRVSVASRGEAIDRTDQSVLFGFASRFSRFPPPTAFFSFPSETTRACHSRVAHRTHATRRGRGANGLDSRARRHLERRGSAGRRPSGDSHPRRGRGKSRLRKQRRQLSGSPICTRRPAIVGH